jgi:hypothetical protein
MRIQANVRFRSRYDGKSMVYLTAIETDSSSDLKVSGEFATDFPELNVDYEMDGEFVGRIYQNNLQLRVDDLSKFKLKKAKKLD